MRVSYFTMNATNSEVLAVGTQVTFYRDGQLVTGTVVEDYRGRAVVQVGNDVNDRVLRVYSRLNVVNGAPAVLTNIVNEDTAALPPAALPNATVEAFDINERFCFIELFVDMVVRGSAKSLIVTGSGGLGKSHTVFNRLKENDLGGADYVKISGHMTPLAVYESLYHNNGKVIVFDDTDAVLRNETTVNLLKAALDSSGSRTVTWASSGRSSALPSSFDFTGRVIFISNFSLKDVPQPLVSRAMYVDVTMTADEKIERIRTIAPRLCPTLTETERNECIELLHSLRNRISELNFRTMLNVAAMRQAQPLQWRSMASYMVTALSN